MKFLRSLPKKKLQKIALVVILTLVGVGAVVNFFIAKKCNALSTERDRIAKLRANIDSAQVSLNAEMQNTELRDQMKVFVQTQRERMITGDPFSWVVREISLLAEQHPVHVNGLRPGTKIMNTARTKYEMFTTRIEAEGSYDEIGVFIRDLENKFTTGQVRSLEVTASDPTRGQCHANFDLVLVVRSDDAGKSTSQLPAEDKKTL